MLLFYIVNLPTASRRAVLAHWFIKSEIWLLIPLKIFFIMFAQLCCFLQFEKGIWRINECLPWPLHLDYGMQPLPFERTQLHSSTRGWLMLISDYWTLVKLACVTSHSRYALYKHGRDAVFLVKGKRLTVLRIVENAKPHAPGNRWTSKSRPTSHIVKQ